MAEFDPRNQGMAELGSENSAMQFSAENGRIRHSMRIPAQSVSVLALLRQKLTCLAFLPSKEAL